MDDPREASRILDRITASVMPKAMKQLGEAYLRGYPAMIRYGAEGLKVEVIPSDQFYLLPDDAESLANKR